MNKSLGFFGLGFLLVLTILSFASASVTFSAPSTISQTSSTFTVTVADNANETVTFTAASATPDANNKLIHIVSVAPSPFTFNTATAPSTTLTVTYTVDSGFVFETGKTYSITITPSSGSPATFNFVSTNEPIGVSTCKVTKAANPNTSLDNIGVTINSNSIITGFGSDTTWYPLDSVEVKVTVDNNGKNDMRKLVVNWALYDTIKQKVILHDKLSSFSLNSDSSKSVKIDLTLDDPSIFKNNNYIFYTWVTGEDKDTSDTTCNTDSQSIDVPLDNHFVVLNSLQIGGTVSCGNQAQITGKIWNIGDSDESGVYVMASNADLGISQRIDIGDISSLDSKDVLFNINIPGNAESGKNYLLALTVYDSDGNIFENDNNDQSKFYINLPVVGTCTNQLPVQVTASLESAAKAGQELDVQAVITNTASNAQTFNLDLSDYTSWASLISIDKISVTLNAGQSQTVLIKLNINKGVSGDQNFNIVMTQGTKTLSQPVSVSVQGTSGINLTGFFSGAQGNTYLWVIGALNVLLVLIIIIVAVRVVSKK